MAFEYSTLVHAYPPLEKRGGSICSSGIYGELAPILQPYPIAQAFCTALYPVSCTSAGLAKRATTTTITTSSKSTATTKSSSAATTKTASLVCIHSEPLNPANNTQRTTTDVDLKASAWSKCQGQGPQVVSTLCSCIEVPKVSLSALIIIDGPQDPSFRQKIYNEIELAIVALMTDPILY
jgi:hypothetical protein